MTTAAEPTHRGPALPGVDRRLDPIREKVLAGQRLSIDDGMLLYETPDLWGVNELAQLVRDRLHPGVGYYNINRHLNYSNVCALSCKFCEFYRKKDDAGAYTHTIEQVREEARKACASGATEMHIVGGLQPYLPWSYYPEMIAAIREIAEKHAAATGCDPLHIKAFTAVEIVHLAKIAKKYSRDDRRAGIRWVLEELKAAGLGSLPGGGAEVFDDRVHDEAFKGKIRSDEWLDVHLVAHELGLNSNATILYGHIDSRRERLIHMEILRRAQDQALTRLGYAGEEAASPGVDPAECSRAARPRRAGRHPDPARHRAAARRVRPPGLLPDDHPAAVLPGRSGARAPARAERAREPDRTLAIARLMLDNFPHVKAFWIMQTLPMSQVMLRSGADDVDGTVVWYDITKVGGATTHQETTAADLCKAIREAGYEPVERDTLYRRVVRDGAKWRVSD